MKKHTLFKILGIVILAYCVLTWIIPATYYYSGSLQALGRYQIGIFDIINLPVKTVGYFGYQILFILAVGGFYAVLEETGLYRKALDKIADKLRPKKKLWVIVIMAIVAVISSVAGLELGTFAFFPFLIALVLLLGYDKLVALSVTIGATIVGMFGSTYSYTMYGVNSSILSVGLKSGILAKVILLVLGLGLLILFTLLYISKNDKKNKEIKKELKSKKVSVKDKAKKATEKVKEVKNEVEALDKFVPSITKELTNKGCKKVWPIYLVLGLVLLVFILGTLNWSSAFGIEWFTNAHKTLMNVKIGNLAIFAKLFGTFDALGTWFGQNKFLYYTGLIVIMTIILALVYKVKFNNLIKSFFEGIKEYLGVAILVTLCYTVLVIVSSFPIFLTVGKGIIGWTKSFNVVTTGLFTILGSPLYVDIYYFPQYVLQYLAGIATNSLSILNILFVSLYSAVMLVAPTSVILLATLQLTDTSYKTWLKFIWKLFLGLVLVSLIVLSIFAII